MGRSIGEHRMKNPRMPHLQSVLREKLSYLRRHSKKAIIFALISIVLGVCLLMARVVPILSPKSMPYSDFVANLHSGIVSDVLFIEGSKGLCYNTSIDEPEGLKLAKECGILSRMRKSREWKFQTSMVGRDEAFLLGLMREKGTTYRSAPMSAFRMLGISLATLMALWIPLTPIMWFYYRTMRGGHGSMMKRRPTNQMVCFDDVEGVDSAKEELMEVVSCLQGSINYNKLGAKLPRGILLVGPPGTGKTLLARAVAGEACVPFFFVSASEFVEMYVGRGAARVRDLFKDARKCEPSIIFIDELDAVGGRRGGSSNDERDQTLIQLLTEMDGFETSSKVVVIAATNRPEALDPALCRSGRFSRKVLVGEPDLNGRKKILAVHLRGIPLDEHPELICNLVSTLTPGSVGADLANIVNEAALLAARRGGDAVTREDFMLAIERGKFGIGRLTPTAISKNLGRLFPWVQSLSRRDDPDQDGIRRYQTLG